MRVRQRAELVILACLTRIGAELDKVPKAGGAGRGNKIIRTPAKSFSGKAGTGVHKDKRSHGARRANRKAAGEFCDDRGSEGAAVGKTHRRPALLECRLSGAEGIDDRKSSSF